MDTRTKGKSGEDMALLYYLNKGCVLLERNYWFQGCEIDLILLDGDSLVFAEVKLRSTEIPRLAVNAAKQARISRAALGFASSRDMLNRPMRFDVVEIRRQGGELRLRHLENAFQFIKGRYFA